jgi:hypothetical protein
MKKVSPAAAIVRIDTMRPFLVLLLAAALAATAVAAAGASLAKTPDADGLELVAGHGRAVVRSQGFLFGKVRRGQIVATTNVRLRHCARRQAEDSGRVVCSGRRLRFASPEYPASWRIVLRGRGITASGVVRGCLILDGADSGETGRYSIGGNQEYRAWPRERWSRALGSGKC